MPGCDKRGTHVCGPAAYGDQRRATGNTRSVVAPPGVAAGRCRSKDATGTEREDTTRTRRIARDSVALNGQFVETISLHRITVKVAPGTNSTIIVTVKNPKNIVYRSGTFNDSQLPFDLDDGIGGAGQLSGNQLVEINRHYEFLESGYELITLNGTESAPWHGSELPTLANCASLPSNDRNTTIVAEQNWGWIKDGTAWVHAHTCRPLWRSGRQWQFVQLSSLENF